MLVITRRRSLEGLSSALTEERNLRSESSLCVRRTQRGPPPLLQPGLSHYSEASVRNRPMRLTRLRTQSVSSVNILRPFDRFATESNRQKGEDPRRPQAGNRVHSVVASAHEIEYCLYIYRHDAFRRHSSCYLVTLLDVIRV